MNRDNRFLCHVESVAKTVKLKHYLKTAHARLKAAKTRYAECLRIYRKADVMYRAKEDRIRRMLKDNVITCPPFPISYAKHLLRNFQTRLEEGEQQLQASEINLEQTKSELRQSQEVLETATVALNLEFVKRNYNVPHLVLQATLPLVQAVAVHGLEYKSREEAVRKAKHVVMEHEHLVHVYREDLTRAMKAQEKLTELKLRRQRQQAQHEQMIATSREALISAKIKTTKIKCSLKQMEVVFKRNQMEL